MAKGGQGSGSQSRLPSDGPAVGSAPTMCLANSGCPHQAWEKADCPWPKFPIAGHQGATPFRDSTWTGIRLLGCSWSLTDK
jgi:hypothetical protein